VNALEIWYTRRRDPLWGWEIEYFAFPGLKSEIWGAHFRVGFASSDAGYPPLSPTGDPRLSTFLRVMKALGIRLITHAA
jgi:hypothetical protein